MDTVGVDYTDVEFIFKSDNATDTLKNNLKLKNIFQDIYNVGERAYMGYKLKFSGGVIGYMLGGTFSIKNAIINMDVNGSKKDDYSFY